MLFVPVLLASAAPIEVTLKNKWDASPQYISSLVYRVPCRVPVEYPEDEHFESGNTASQTVSGSFSMEREASAPAEPFAGWSLETVEAAVGRPTRIGKSFSVFDRKILTPQSSVRFDSQCRQPSRHQLWARRRVAR